MARTRDGSVLGDVADEDDGRAVFLRETDKLLRGGADLADGAGRALDQVRVHGLDGIDDQQIGAPISAEGREDVANRRRRCEPHRRLAKAEPHGAQTHLLSRFLARDVDDVPALAREIGADLKQQRRLADPRIAADQHRGAGNDAATDRTVELGDTRRDPLRQRDRMIEADQLDLPPAALKVMLGGEDAGDLGSLLHQRIPLRAVRALALPAGRHRPAGLADVTGLRLGHPAPILLERSRNTRRQNTASALLPIIC